MSTIKTNTIQPTQAGNNLIFANGTAVEAMRITDGGLVGVGITPLSELHVVGTQNYGSAANSGILTVGNANNSRQINFGVSDSNSVVWIEGWVPGTGGSDIVLQPSGGSVGIGIAVPAANLDVAGGNSQVWIRAGSGGGLAASAGAGLKLEYVSGDSTAKLQAYDYSANTGKNIVLNGSGGNVGIGNITPLVALHVAGEARSSTSTTAASAATTLTTKDYVDGTSSKATSGYTKLPNGILIQWGETAVAGVHGTNYTITYPTAFTTFWTNTFVVQNNALSTIDTVQYLHGKTTTTPNSNFIVQSGTYRTGATQACTVRWFAIGLG